jgi:hypothetical protein
VRQRGRRMPHAVTHNIGSSGCVEAGVFESVAKDCGKVAGIGKGGLQEAQW